MKHVLFILFCFVLLNAIGQVNPMDEAYERYSKHPETAKNNLFHLLELAKKENNQKNEAKCLSYLGVISDIEGDSKQAISLLQKAIRIQVRHHFEKDLSFSYNNLGIAHFYQDNFEYALIYYTKSFGIDSKLGDRQGAAGTLVNIGLVNTYLGNFDRAIANYQRASKIYSQLQDTIGQISCISNVAKVQFDQKNFVAAKNNYLLCQQLAPENLGTETRFALYNGLANVEYELGAYENGEKKAIEAIALAEKMGAKERLQYGYEILAKIYAARGKHQLAYETLQRFTKLREELVNENNRTAIAEMETKFQTEQKDNALLEAKTKRLEQEKNIDSFRSRLFIALFIIAALLITIGLFWYFYSHKRKQALLLSERNTAIEANLKQKEIMIGEIHHRVKNNLQLISSIIDLHARTLENSREKEVLLDSRKRVESIAVVHQKLYQNDEIYNIDLQDYVTDLGQTLLLHFADRDRPVQLLVETSSACNVHLDTAIPLGLILSELITNSLKYAFQTISVPIIHIRFSKSGSTLQLIYNDNGKGMTETDWENSQSFGKRMMGSLMRQLKAQSTFKNNSGFELTILCKNIIWSEHE